MKEIIKGTTYLLIAQLAFIISGYLIHFGLGRLLGPELYGIYGVALSLITISTIITNSGIPLALSKYVSENESLAKIVKKTALKLQLILSFSLFLVFFLLADFIALLLNDLKLISYIRLIAFVIPCYAFYSLFSNYLNGLREFKKQSKTIIFYSLSKLIAIFTLVFLGFAVFGAIAGFMIAPFLAMVLGIYYSSKIKTMSRETFFPTRKIICFAAPMIVFSLSTTLIQNIDILAVKIFSPLELANKLTGFYNAASTISKIPYFLIPALTMALFPTISRLTSLKNHKLTRRYVQQALRYSLMFLLPFSFLVASTSPELMTLIYSKSYIDGSLPLPILTFGIMFLTLFVVTATIISGSGKPKIPMLILFFVVIIDYLLNFLLVPRYSLVGAAIATTFASALALIISSLYIVKNFKVLVSFSSFMRITLASLIIFLISMLTPVHGLLLLVKYAFLGFIYFVCLIVLKEIKKGDLRIFEDALPFGKRAVKLFEKFI